MNFQQALGLQKRIKQDRDVLTWIMGAPGGFMVMVREVTRERGYYPLKRGHPRFVESESDWEVLKQELS